MGTKPRRPVAALHYYIKEWAQHLGKSDDEMAECMGYAQRSGVWKLYKEQHRLTPDKVVRAAQCLGISPRALMFPPNVPSLDDLAEGATMEQRAAIIADIARRMRQ